MRLDEVKLGLFRWVLIDKKNRLIHTYTGEVESVCHFYNGEVLVNFACDKKRNDENDWEYSYGCLG